MCIALDKLPREAFISDIGNEHMEFAILGILLILVKDVADSVALEAILLLP